MADDGGPYAANTGRPGEAIPDIGAADKAAPDLAAAPDPTTAADPADPPDPDSPAHRRAIPRRVLLLVSLALVVAIVAVVVTVQVTRSPGAQPGDAARGYLAAWSRNDYAAMAGLVRSPPPTFAATHRRVMTDLDLTSSQYQLGAVTSRGTTADAAFRAHLVLAGLGPWDYTNTLHLSRLHAGWMVEWSPATIFPTYPAGGHFSRERSWAPRASVLGTNATVLAGAAPLVTIGLQGSAITNPTQLTMALTQIGFEPAAIAAALRAAVAHPDQFVAVGDLTDTRYQQVKSVIFPVPGTRFRNHSGQTTMTPDLAAHVVGSVGPITAEERTVLGAPYQATDLVGQGGIEAQYERQLAGTPGGDVTIVAGDGTVASTALTVAPKAGTPVQTTLDLDVELAAEAALKGVSQAAAIVAIRASTGEVLAAVSRPLSAPFDRSLNGRYPPGSTFKVITTAALLGRGLTPDSPATCPKTLTVSGKVFQNFEGEVATSLTLQRAFAVSCNTAFIGLAGGLTSPSLVTEAGRFGFGTTPQPGVPVFGGQVPPAVDEVEKVATAIGQGRVLASPLQMAGVAAAVDNGAYHAPRLVAGAPDDTVSPVALAPAVVSSLRMMMAAVVTSGTGASANVTGGGPVYGKTGTAEFGSAAPPLTHAWFIGYRGDIAFSVLVEAGGVGGVVAAPIAAKFLRSLPPG